MKFLFGAHKLTLTPNLQPRMASETKPLLKYSSDEYSARPSSVRALWNHVENAGRIVTRTWAKAIRVVHLREVFAEFLATFALLVSCVK